MQSARQWAHQQWSRVHLGDQRLNARTLAMGLKMAEQPQASLPEQMRQPAALKGAYRLLNHPGVTLEHLSGPHCQQTRRQARRRRGQVLLWVHDGTELDLEDGRQPRKRGLGPIGDGRRRGLILHSVLGVVADTREVLGLGDVQVCLRQAPRAADAPRRPKWSRSPEGQVWVWAATQIGKPPTQRDALWVHVGDRQADMFEFVSECVTQHTHFVVRAYHNRLVPEAQLDWAPTPLPRQPPPKPQPQAQADTPTDTTTDTPAKAKRRTPNPGGVLAYARRLKPKGKRRYQVYVRAQEDQPARTATLALSWARVTLRASREAPQDLRALPAVQAWVVRAWEPEPPPEAEPLEWVLLTSVPTRSWDAARRRVIWYACRPMIEDYHQCLKTGCRVERNQFDDGAAVQRLLGFLAPIAVRLLQVRQAARHTPMLPARKVVDPLLVTVLVRHPDALYYGADARTLTIEQFWRAVARLGGHQGRKRDGPPGWRTLWRGYRHLSELAQGARLMED